jgi:hypothetical protein
MARSNDDALLGQVDIRVSFSSHYDPIFIRVHSSDTLGLLVSQIETFLEMNKSLFGVQEPFSFSFGSSFDIENMSMNPHLKLEKVQLNQTIQTLGMWPGGSVRVIFTHLATELVEETSSSKKAKATTSSRPLPSEILSSHKTRFDDDPLLRAEVNFHLVDVLFVFLFSLVYFCFTHLSLFFSRLLLISLQVSVVSKY